MGLLFAMIVGIVVGALGSVLLQKSYDMLLVTILLAVGGAIIGDAVYYFASSNDFLLFSWGGLLSQLLGALIFVLIFSALNRVTGEITK